MLLRTIRCYFRKIIWKSINRSLHVDYHLNNHKSHRREHIARMKNWTMHCNRILRPLNGKGITGNLLIICNWMQPIQMRRFRQQICMACVDGLNALGEYKMVYQKLLPHGQRLQMSIHICYTTIYRCGWISNPVPESKRQQICTILNKNYSKQIIWKRNALFYERFRKAKTMMRPSHKMYAKDTKKNLYMCTQPATIT